MVKVGLVCDVNLIGLVTYHCLSEKYLYAVAMGAGATPVIIPALVQPSHQGQPVYQPNLMEWLDDLDGVMFTGSPSMVEPSIYGCGVEREDTLLDRQRDAVSLPLIRAAIERGIPLLAICRGFQELNVALGGTLHQQIQNLPGKIDHRSYEKPNLDELYSPTHYVNLVPGGAVAKMAGVEKMFVNSVHWQGVDQLAPGLTVEASCADDGIIEAVRVTNAKAFALGFQWHPEWKFWDDEFGKKLFSSFGQAAHDYAQSRRFSHQARISA
ncbi:MAG: gamma-glutamyl-gamma-aminobutyrate hydrolase family protein [Candidatus Pacebacteria bacterium]|nr:gamma-glutamyl-gamma-aminobutyrate hydrolase family protein [Candidatus Paceibacterota bacterium]